mgnify:CR=1 FL=1
MIFSVKDIQYNDDTDTVEVYIKIPLRGDQKPKEKLHTSDVVQLLKKENIEVLSCINGTTLSNVNPSKLEGKWVFKIESTKKQSIPSAPSDSAENLISEANLVKDNIISLIDDNDSSSLSSGLVDIPNISSVSEKKKRKLLKIQ